MNLSPGHLSRMPLEEALRVAVEEARRLEGGAYRRHLRYIARLLKRGDPEALRSAMEHVMDSGPAAGARRRRLEARRDRLLSGGDEAIQELIEEFPLSDRQRVRRMVRGARAEHDAGGEGETGSGACASGLPPGTRARRAPVALRFGPGRGALRPRSRFFAAVVLARRPAGGGGQARNQARAEAAEGQVAGSKGTRRRRPVFHPSMLLGGARRGIRGRHGPAPPALFPADHGPHPEYRSEWWYFTGNVEDSETGTTFRVSAHLLSISSRRERRSNGAPSGRRSRCTWRILP